MDKRFLQSVDESPLSLSPLSSFKLPSFFSANFLATLAASLVLFKGTRAESSSSSDDEKDRKGGRGARGRRSKSSRYGASVTGLEELDPPRDEFADVVSYRHYRLANSSWKYDCRVARPLARKMKGMKMTFIPEKFSDEDPILVLEFLINF